MADFLMWRLFLLVCVFFSVARVSLILYYTCEDWPVEVPYNSRHSYDRARRLFLHDLTVSSPENRSSGEKVKSKELGSESRDNFQNLTEEEIGQMQESEGRGEKLPVLWEEGSNAHDKENVWKGMKERGSEFPINSPNVCAQKIFLLILVHSFPQNDQQRDAVRNTYGKNLTRVLDRNVKVVFFCPSTSPDKAAVYRMTKEKWEKNDLVHSNVADSTTVFRPSSKAMLSEFKWVQTYCNSAKFILCANDKQFVNVELLVRRMKQHEKNDLGSFYLGRVKNDAKPNRLPEDGQYVPGSAFPGEQYPKFCIAEAGMVLSNAFINSVYDAAVQFLTEVKTFPLSDVMLGIVANKLKKPPMYNDKFRKTGGEAVYCDLKGTLVLGGLDTPPSLTDVWANFTEHKQNWCPNPEPNATEIEEWTHDVNNTHYLGEVLHLIHNPVRICSEENGHNEVFLLALVSTHPDHYELRDAIRRTWADPKYQDRFKIKTLFVIARPRIENPDKIERTRIEFEEHNDLVQAEFRENFFNLTLKVILGLRWVSMYCPGASFVYKGDDDMLVNFERITKYLRALSPTDGKELFLGNMMRYSLAIRERSRYQILRTQYPFKFYLPYFSGGGYIMAQLAVRKMYQKALSTRIIPIDDAYAGILAFRSGIRLTPSGGFITSHICRLKEGYNQHGFRAASTMISTWEQFTNETYTNETCGSIRGIR